MISVVAAAQRSVLGPLAGDPRIVAANAAVAPLMHDAVLGLRPSMRDLALEHLGWPPEPGRPVALLGKGVRSLLALVAADMIAGTPDAGVRAAACVELVHESGLVHDDPMDRDVVRRGRPAVWAAHGVPAAILLGTALSTLALQVLQDQPPEQRDRMTALWAATMQDMVVGQARDVELAEAATDAVDPTGWEDMAERKTGALFGAAMAMGAVTGGADAPTVTAFDRIGRLLGVAYQIEDDILAIWGDPAVTGKPAVREPSARLYPVVVMADQLDPVTPGGGRTTCQQLLAGTPAQERCVAAVRRLTAEALALLTASPDRSGSSVALRALVASLVDRQR